MNYQSVTSGIVQGITGQLIRVEVELQNGLPYFAMVGYLSKESLEARQRVSSALRSIGYPLPSKKITVNLSPAQIKKSGTAFDFPMAVAFLAALDQIPKDQLNNICVMGELGLNGRIRGVGNCLPVVMEAKKQGLSTFFVSKEDKDALRLMDDVEIVYMDHLEDVIGYFNGTLQKDKGIKVVPKKPIFNEDYSQVHGQEHMKRAIEIAVAGRHHLLIIGSPGCGKTMVSHRVPSILPSLTKEQHLEVQSIYDATGIPRDIEDFMPPVRIPSLNISKAALLGGGQGPKAGEVTLAHHGVLVLDEFMDFKLECLEGLKQCMEDKKITINRLGKTISFAADFQIIATMNPCACGYALEDGKCRCTNHQKQGYLKKLQGPILDRFDMIITATEQKEEFISKKAIKTSKEMRQRIMDYHGTFNEDSSLSKECLKLLEDAYDMKKLTRRGVDKITRLAKTISTLDHSEIIEPIHIIEALTFRNVDFVKEVLGHGR